MIHCRLPYTMQSACQLGGDNCIYMIVARSRADALCNMAVGRAACAPVGCSRRRVAFKQQTFVALV